MLEMCAASSAASLAPLMRFWISSPAAGGVAVNVVGHGERKITDAMTVVAVLHAARRRSSP